MELLRKLFPNIFGLDEETKERLEDAIAELIALEEIFQKTVPFNPNPNTAHPFKYLKLFGSEIEGISSESKVYLKLIRYHLKQLQNPNNLKTKLDIADAFITEVFSLNQKLQDVVMLRTLERNPDDWKLLIPQIFETISFKPNMGYIFQLIDTDSVRKEIEAEPHEFIEHFFDDMRYGNLRDLPQYLSESIVDIHAQYTNFDELVRRFGWFDIYVVIATNKEKFSERFSEFWRVMDETERYSLLSHCISDREFFFSSHFALCPSDVQEQILDNLGISPGIYMYIRFIPKEKRFEFLAKHLKEETTDLSDVEYIIDPEKDICRCIGTKDEVITEQEIDDLFQIADARFHDDDDYFYYMKRKYGVWKQCIGK